MNAVSSISQGFIPSRLPATQRVSRHVSAKTRWQVLVVAMTAIGCFTTRGAAAQELEPRSFTNIPVGETFVVFAASQSQGGVAPTPEAVLQDLDLTIDVASVGVAHSFAIAGQSAKFDAVVARTCYEGSAVFRGEFREGRRCEYLDPSFRLGWNFYGAPAKNLDEFRQWKPGLVAGISVQLTPPWGDYQSDRLINAGANRWSVRPALGMSYRQGRWHYDLIASVRVFEDNDNFFGGLTVERQPLYAAQSHLIYNFDRGRWISLNANFYAGGETIKGGIRSNDELRNSRWGVTFSTPLSPKLSLQTFANTGVINRAGTDFDTFGLLLQYRM